MELTGFKRLNERPNPELLGNDELTKLEDCVLDKELGKPQKRGGWAKFNTNQVDTTDHISSLHEVVAKGGNNYLLAGINDKLRKSLDGTGTWDDVTSKGTPPYRMQAYADTFIFTDGNVAPFVVSGNTLETVTDLEITKPDVSLVETGLNSDLGGSLTTTRWYKWVIVYVTDDGTMSNPSQPISVFCTAGRVGFRYLPISSDARVTHRYIYRTKANEDVFYFHSEIDNIATSWLDEKSDSDLGTEIASFLNMPSAAKYISLHKERLILGNISKLTKNWIMPAHSKGASSSFVVTQIYGGYTFTPSTGFENSVAASSGTMTAGTYTYRVVFYDAEKIMSDYYDSNSVTIDGITENAVLLYDLPNLQTDYDVITNASIYRKKDSGNFELLTSYDPRRRSGVVEFNFADNGQYTPTTVYATNQTTDSKKCSIALSEIGTPAVFLLENIRDIFPDDGDEITGIYDDLDGILIFKMRSICKIYTNGSPDNWRLVKLVTGIGCDEPYSITKFGNDYIFSFQNEIYRYNSGNYEKIGLEIQDTLDTVTAYHCATANQRWYLLGVSFGSTYGFLIYDYTVGSWYKFNTTSIPYVAHIKEQRTNAGTILTSNATYILKYGTGTADTDTGTDVDIVPVIRTKTFGEGTVLNRLRKLWFNYKKLSDKTCTITIVNPDTGITNTHTDTSGSGWKLLEEVTGKVTDSLKETDKFYIQITGAGFEEFGNLRIDLRQIKRGRIAV